MLPLRDIYEVWFIDNTRKLVLAATVYDKLYDAFPQVLLEVRQLLEHFERSSEGRLKRMLLILNAYGYQQQFQLLEQELRDCLVQLSAILNISLFTSQSASMQQVGIPLHLSISLSSPNLLPPLAAGWDGRHASPVASMHVMMLQC
jgi:hypothetical protein